MNSATLHLPTVIVRRCYTAGMRVLGIDCGGEYTGYGVVEQGGDAALVCLAAGAVRLNRRDPLAVRLLRVNQELRAVIQQYQPEVAAIEDVFHAANAKAALKLGEVRGVAMLTAAACGLAVVGYGRAEKAQVQEMVMRLLRLPQRPKPADVADALAIAICHLHTAGTLAQQRVGAR